MEKKVYLPGVYDISNAEYHAAAGISRSGLWAFKQLPHKYWYQYLSGEYEEKESKAFFLGSLAHTLILEPHLFDQEYCLKPKLEPMPPEVRLKDVGKEQFEQVKAARKEVKDRNDALKAAFEQDMASKLMVSEEDFALANGMRNAVFANETAVQLLDGAKIEKSIYWQDSVTGLLLKTRPDVWNAGVVCDLKTCNDASMRGFQRDALKDGYFLQAAMMYEGLKSIGEPFEKFVFICVEKKPPFSTALYMLDDEALQFGLDLMRKLLDDYKRCLDKNEWPDYGVQMLMIPRYATLEYEHE